MNLIKRFRHAAISIAGPVRETNEDACSVALFHSGEVRALQSAIHWQDCPEQGVLFTVSDGVGGSNAGEVASRMTAEGLPREVNALMPAANAPQAQKEAMLVAVAKVHENVCAASSCDAERENMAATVTALWILQDRAIVVHAGDSRLYQCRGADTRQVTEDHSRVARLVREGRLSLNEARTHPERNIIEQAVGARNLRFHPDVFEIDLRPGDRFLLCTDGVTDGLPNESIAEYFEDHWPDNLDEYCRDFVKAAVRASGRDNLTALLVEI